MRNSSNLITNEINKTQKNKEIYWTPPKKGDSLYKVLISKVQNKSVESLPNYNLD